MVTDKGDVHPVLQNASAPIRKDKSLMFKLCLQPHVWWASHQRGAMQDQCGCKLPCFTFRQTRAEFANRLESDDYSGLRAHVAVCGANCKKHVAFFSLVYPHISLITELRADGGILVVKEMFSCSGCLDILNKHNNTRQLESWTYFQL